jgi:hypothetical protein
MLEDSCKSEEKSDSLIHKVNLTIHIGLGVSSMKEAYFIVGEFVDIKSKKELFFFLNKQQLTYINADQSHSISTNKT